MIKITALYRWHEGATFDHDYYHGEHMRIARQALGPLGLVRLESDRVMYPGPPRPGQVVALTNAFFETVEQAQAAAQQTAPVLTADVPNYTDIKPESYMAQMKAHPLGG
ncbi:EthD family reductase [Acidovorax sp. A1169]|uniref:EthD family reductase n=1 Tax=Acidovorax sp. A1169 TaxID=3059524 RepID=UPI002737CE6D|nr:EthD family reductase [Acidovorax sp. A1169]MDP4077927.1 EthD family reductase [Acidovorax sp. A1169]